MTRLTPLTQGKFAIVDAGIDTFDQAFLAHVMLPDGRTVGDWAAEALPSALEGRALPPLIDGPRHKDENDDRAD